MVHQLKSKSRTNCKEFFLDYWLKDAQPAKLDLNKKSLPKQKTIQNLTIDAQGFRRTANENPPMREIKVTS